jgi:multidrug resistance efflux pump
MTLMSRTLFRRAVLSAAVAIAGWGALATAETKTAVAAGATPVAAAAVARQNVSILTQPSEQRKLSFMTPGIIKESLVHDGDTVKAGHVLMKQDTDMDLKEAERLKVEAESLSRIEAAQADEKVKQIEYDRKSKAPNAYAASEIEEAQAKLIEAQKSVKVAEEDRQQAQIKFAQQQIKLQKMELLCPSDMPGDWIVQHVVTNVGEMADPQSRDGTILVVKNDPLYVEIRGLTTLQVSTLKVGEKLQLRYRNDPGTDWKDAEIIYITPVADAGADRQLVRLKLANSEGRPAGLNMDLNWPKKLLDTAPKDDAMLSFK